MTVVAHLEANVIRLSKNSGELGLGDFDLVVPHASIVALIAEDRLVDDDAAIATILLNDEDLVIAHVSLSLEVARSRENVADSELGVVPLSFVLGDVSVNIGEVLATTLLENVLGVLEDNAIN